MKSGLKRQMKMTKMMKMESQMAQICNKDKIRVCIAVVFGMAALLMYAIYQYHWFYHGEKLNELHFSVTSLTLGVYSFLIGTYINNYHSRALMFLVSGFYIILDLIYVYNWCLMHGAYTSIKFSLFFGFGIALIYWLYELVYRYSNKPR